MLALAAFLPKLAVFFVSAAISGSVAYVATAALSNEGPVTTAGQRPEHELVVADADSGPISFDMIQRPGAPAVIEPLEPDSLETVATATLDGGPPAWLNPSGFPRITPVTQFDGGPFQGSNCTLASGAMLARLGFGIVTTGSILRTLQDDQVGGTGLDDLGDALWRGYGVSVRTGALRPNQLKSLLAAGYGAVIQGTYGRIPPALRIQRDYTGGHAIYVDGYFAGSGSTPEAYFVVDPLGRPQHGYEGEWWPASVVDDFGTAFGGGRIWSAWVFPPGGVPPEVVGPDVVPIPPSGGDTPQPSVEPSIPPEDSPDPSGDPSFDPGLVAPGEPGDVDPGLPPVIVSIDPLVTIGEVDIQVWLEVCLVPPLPSGCPPGVIGVFEVDVGALAVDPGPTVDVLFVDSDRPNVAYIGFTVDPPVPVELRYWDATTSPGTLEHAAVITPISLFGQTVHVAKLDVTASTAYHFQVIAGGGGTVGLSPVGTFTSGGGVRFFEVDLASVASPVVDVIPGLSPYLRLGEGLAPPAADLCPVARVDFALDGVEADGVLVRAFPRSSDGLADALLGSLERELTATEGSTEIGCLVPGTSYNLVIDPLGDAGGPIVLRTIDVP